LDALSISRQSLKISAKFPALHCYLCPVSHAGRPQALVWTAKLQYARAPILQARHPTSLLQCRDGKSRLPLSMSTSRGAGTQLCPQRAWFYPSATHSK
jgi:hypothetical protein